MMTMKRKRRKKNEFASTHVDTLFLFRRQKMIPLWARITCIVIDLALSITSFCIDEKKNVTPKLFYLIILNFTLVMTYIIDSFAFHVFMRWFATCIVILSYANNAFTNEWAKGLVFILLNLENVYFAYEATRVDEKLRKVSDEQPVANLI